jgi:alpha-amylase
MPTMDFNWMRWDATKVVVTKGVTTTGAKVVGWPLPILPTDLYAYDKIAALALTMKSIGITKALFPPSTLGSSGRYSGGYDKKEDYIFNGTAFGDEANCISAVTALNVNGVEVVGDAVLHQYDGYPAQQYKSAIFPKTPTCFAWETGQTLYPGNVTPDSVPDSSGGWPDGDLAAYAQPDRYMWNGAIAAILNQMKVLGIRHWRIDEAKDLHAPFLCALIDAVRKVYPDAQFTGEYFDGNPAALGGWVNYWMNRRARVYDFMFKFNIGTICNNNSNSWMGRLSDIGYCMQDSMMAQTFVENADTDTSPGEQTIWNKQLGYDAMFALPGDPMIYYRDWAADEYCYNMKTRINNGLWRRKNLAQGTFVTRNAEFQTFACERLGYGEAPGCIAFFNNDQWNAHTVYARTRYSANTRLHEYTGNAGYSADKWTDWQGGINVEIPRNINGCNSLMYAPYL